MKPFHTQKKILILTGILLLTIIPCFSREESGILSIKGSHTIDALHPPALSIDNNIETYTGFNAASGEQGWIELTTNGDTFIYGLTIETEIPVDTAVVIEYKKNGVYYPFISSFINGPLYGGQVIDLSFDRIITDTIRLKFTGPTLSLVKLYELALLGDTPGTRAMRIQPDHMRSDFKNSRFFSEQNLVDRLPGTFWMTWKDENIKGINWSLYDVMDEFYIDEEPSDNKENVVFLFNEPGPFDAIYMYITDLAMGTADVMINLPSNRVILETINLNTIRGWHKIDIPDALTEINNIEIEYYGNTDEYGGIGEVEFVRTEPYAGDTYQEIILPLTVEEETEVHTIFPLGTFAPDDTFVIETAVAASQAFSVTINGKEKSATEHIDFPGYAVYTYTLDSTEIWGGDNFFSYISGTGEATLLYARIRKSPEDGFTPVEGNNLGDKKLINPGSHSGEFVYEFDETYYIDKLLVHGIDTFDVIMSWWDGTDWQELLFETINPHLKRTTDSFTTRKLKVNAPGGHLSEIELSIRRTEDKTPAIKILYPEYGYQEEQLSDLVNKDFICLVDNGDSIVTINGLTPISHGTLFRVSMTDLLGDFEDGLFDFTIDVIDAEGREAHASISILVNKYNYQFVIDQGTDEIIHTTEETFTISGYYQHPQGRLYINDEEVTITESEVLTWSFSHVVTLESGMNLFELVVHHESTGRILTAAVVRVFKFSHSLYLSITDPKDLSLVNTETVIVSGGVRGIGDIGVEVNGSPCSVEGTRFISEEIPLTEGPNTLNITATDESGDTTEQTITVIRDTIAPVITAVTPVDGTWFNTSNIGVSGTVIETNGCYVYVNGLPATVQNGIFNKSIICNEGENPVSITAADKSGNISASYSCTLHVDTTPPEPFNAATDSTGWTNNPQPVVTFSTTDSGSGMNRYEIFIDGGTPFIAFSPHTLPVLEDGIHAVTVRAIDNVGNVQTSTVEVSIDTTPPDDPKSFRIIPGKDNIHVKWDKPDEDIVEYRLIRLPEWDAGGSIIVTEQSYTDTLVEFGLAYEYQIICVDRAGNLSPGAEIMDSIVGIEVETYNYEEGTIAEYENVTLLIKPESLPETIEYVTISEIESDDLKELSPYPITGPMYRFNVIQEEDGELKLKDHIEFEEEFICWLDYNEEDLPAYFPEQNIGVFYFNTLWSRWFKVEKSFVDIENNRIFFITNHFSDYSVQPVMLEDLSPQEIQDVGYSPFKADVVHEGITISPQGGSAMTQVTELVLPGKGGFNFEIKRTYDSATARSDSPSYALNASLSLSATNALPGIVDFLVQLGMTNIVGELEAKLEALAYNAGDYCYSMGIGWRLNFPYIKGVNGGVILRLPDGSYHNINKMKRTDAQYNTSERFLTFVNHEGADFTISILQARGDINITGIGSTLLTSLFNKNKDKGNVVGVVESFIPGWVLVEATVTMADGTVYTFDKSGKVKSIEDSTRLNTISFEYLWNNRLDTITDSMGREITFTYDSTGLIGIMPRISSMSVDDVDGSTKTITYTGENDFDFFEDISMFALDRLSSATDFEGRTWDYEYDKFDIVSGLVGAKVNPVILVLEFIPWIKDALVLLGLNSITVFGRLQWEIATALSHIDGPGVGFVDITYDLKAHDSFYAEGADYIFDTIPTAAQFTMEWQGRLYAKKVEESNGDMVKTTNYSYTIDNVWGNQFYTSETRVNDGRLRRVYSYDVVRKDRNRFADDFDWAIDQILSVGITEGKEIREYVPYNTRVEYYNVEGGIEQYLQTEYTDMDTTTMRVQSKTLARLGGVNFTTTDYEYDNWGNVVHTKDVTILNDRRTSAESWMYYARTNSEQSTEITWPPGAYAAPDLGHGVNIHSILLGKAVKISVPNLEGEDGERFQYSYNKFNDYGQMTATKQWIGEGTYSTGNPGERAITRFEYDEWGNVNKIINPENHETSIVYNYDYSNYWYTVTTTEHDVRDIDDVTTDITSIVAYEKATGKKAWEQNPRKFTTEYAYDKIGRIVAIKKPAANATPNIPSHNTT